MEILQLETFLAVATYGGFHRAADALRVSQPAVSARISTLEESLGTRLFEREHGKFSLSLAGKALRPHAEQLLRQVAVARQAVHELHPLREGLYRLRLRFPFALTCFPKSSRNIRRVIRKSSSACEAETPPKY